VGARHRLYHAPAVYVTAGVRGLDGIGDRMMRTTTETLRIAGMRSMTLRLGMRPGSLIIASFDDQAPHVLLHQEHLRHNGRLRHTCLTASAVELADVPEASLACLLYDPDT
jgi:hypothetical protein